MNKKFVISLIGAPASGKGYIAASLIKRLKDDYGFEESDIAAISVGAMIRQELKSHTPLGQKLAANMKEGGLAPDSIVNEMLSDTLENIKAKILILDGYPRTVGQVKEFDKLVAKYNSAVIFRDTPVDLILERVKNRRICEKCGMAHDIGDGACPCGGRLIKRKDDEVLPERLAEYEEMTRPAVIELKNEGNNFFWYEGDGRRGRNCQRISGSECKVFAVIFFGNGEVRNAAILPVLSVGKPRRVCYEIFVLL